MLGSRYAAGGRVEEWGGLRRAVSRGGSAYARAALGVDVADLTGGFKVFRREVLEEIDLESIESLGLRVPGGDDLPRDQGRASGSSRCRSPSATARSASRRCRSGSCSRRRCGSRVCAFAAADPLMLRAR